MTIIPERLIEIESKPLRKGNGKSIDTACVMNMVAYIAGEPWSDHPECACPTLTKMAIGLNDRMDDEQRQKLAPLIPLLVGTKGTRKDRKARTDFIIWRNLAVTFPIFLDLIGMAEYAAELRLTPQTVEGFQAAGKNLREKRSEIAEAVRRTAATADAAAAAADASAVYADAAATAAADASDTYAAATVYAVYADVAAAAAAANAFAAAVYADTAATAAADAAATADASAAYAYASASASSAYAAAYAADAATNSSSKNLINNSVIETLRLACAIKHEEIRDGN